MGEASNSASMGHCGEQRIFDTVEEFWGDDELEEAILATTSVADRQVEEFEQEFLAYIGSGGEAQFVPSGREAIEIALQTLCPDGSGLVVMPAFCCSVVGEAVLRAGMRPVLIDSGLTTGSVDWNACETAMTQPGVRAVIIPHLFGLPLDPAPITELAARRGIAIIEDCAHCLGGKINGHMVGTLGDFGVFSFSYDKPISLGGGGMLICNRRSLSLAADAVQIRRSGDHAARDEEIGSLREFRAWIMRRRSAIPSPNLSPRARMAGQVRRSLDNHVRVRWMLKTVIRPASQAGAFRVPRAIGPVRAALGRSLLRVYESTLVRRAHNHEFLARELDAETGVKMLVAPCHVSPAWLKAKLQVAPWLQNRVEPLSQRLCSAGFSAGRFNWPRTLDRETSIAFVALRIGSLENAHRIAKSTIDMPIHQRMDEDQIRDMASHIREDTSAKPQTPPQVARGTN